MEVIGAVASSELSRKEHGNHVPSDSQLGIALVDAAARLAQSCLKLYEFWDSIRDAPRDIQGILVDIRIMQNILSDISSEKKLAPSVLLILSSCVEKTRVRHLFYFQHTVLPCL
jgi:hypothetical protein